MKSTPCIQSLIAIGSMLFIPWNLYCARLETLNLDSLRQSQIEAPRSEGRSLAPSGQGEEKDRFGKVAASPNLKFLAARSIMTGLENGEHHQKNRGSCFCPPEQGPPGPPGENNFINTFGSYFTLSEKEDFSGQFPIDQVNSNVNMFNVP